MSVRCVVGLGNPGATYARTRHNAGWRVVEAKVAALGLRFREERAFRGQLAKPEGVSGGPLFLLPHTYMNESGVCVRSVVDFFKIKIDSVLVVYDEINLSLGSMKLSVTGSAGGHNGVASLLNQLGTGFLRLRIGIGGKQHREQTLADHVLAPFSDSEEEVFRLNLPNYLAALDRVLSHGAEAMAVVNQRSNSP